VGRRIGAGLTTPLFKNRAEIARAPV